MSHTVLSKFSADFPDLVLECIIRKNVVICFSCTLIEFLFCHDFPNVVHKELQHIELFRGQVKILPVQKDFSGPQIDFQAEFGDLNQIGLFSIGA